MNEIVNKFLLAGDKFMPEMHLSLDLHMIFVDLYKKQRKDQNIWRQETNNKYKLHKAYFQHYIA